MKRRSALVALLMTALALTGCTGFQTTGEVAPGLEIEELPPLDSAFDPDGPQNGATPEQIVRGFMQAASSPDGDWSIARTFLTPEVATEWVPSQNTLVDELSKRVYSTLNEPTPTPTAGQPTPAPDKGATDPVDTPSPTPSPSGTTTIIVEFSAIANVDAHGVYRAADAGVTRLEFVLNQSSEGDWRIQTPPQGVIIDKFSFENVFKSFDVTFFDPTWRYLVPDTRWFPEVTGVRDVVNGLLAGASPWLLGAVTTAVPQGTRSGGSIPVDADGKATITLSGIDGIDSETAGRIKLQLLASLRNAGVRDIALMNSTREFTSPIASVPSIDLKQQAIVLVDGVVGIQTTTGFDEIAELTVALGGIATTSLEVSESAGVGTALITDGSVVRLYAGREPATIDARDGLIAPTIGPFGDIWTAQKSDSNSLMVTMPGGRAVELQSALADLTSITSMQISRDGTRLAVAGTIGSQNSVFVFGVIRDTDGVPTGLGDAYKIRDLRIGAAISLAWLDSATVGLVVPDENDTAIVVQPLAGPYSTTRAPDDIVSIAGGSDPSTMWIRQNDGTLFTSRGTSWPVVSEDIAVLARQQGAAVEQ